MPTFSKLSGPITFQGDAHAPELWIFEHHHKSCDFTFEGTQFHCLDELETMVVDF